MMSEPISTSSCTVDEALYSWISSMVGTIGYGEVGLSLVIVDGQVVRVKKTVEEVRKLVSRSSRCVEKY